VKNQRSIPHVEVDAEGLTTVLDVGESSASCSVHVTPGRKSPFYTRNRRLDSLQSHSEQWRRHQSLDPAGNQPKFL
jgi:hypothetical protein